MCLWHECQCELTEQRSRCIRKNMARRCRSEVQNCKVGSLSSKRERNAAYPSLHSENPHFPRRALPPSLPGLGKTLDYCLWLAPSQICLLVPSVKRAVASRGKICATFTPVLSAVKEPPVRLDLDWGLLGARAGKRYRRCKTIRSAETVLRGWRSCTLMRRPESEPISCVVSE